MNTESADPVEAEFNRAVARGLSLPWPNWPPPRADCSDCPWEVVDSRRCKECRDLCRAWDTRAKTIAELAGGPSGSFPFGSPVAPRAALAYTMARLERLGDPTEGQVTTLLRVAYNLLSGAAEGSGLEEVELEARRSLIGGPPRGMPCATSSARIARSGAPVRATDTSRRTRREHK